MAFQAGQNNWIFLGNLGMASDGPTTGVLDIPSMDILTVHYSINGYATVDTAGFNFNRTQDLGFGGFHADRHIYAAAGTTTLTDNFDNAGTAGTGTSIRVAGFTTSQSQTGTMHVLASPGSYPYRPTLIYNATSGIPGNAPPLEFPSPGCFQVADNITSIELLTRFGGNMFAGTGFTVYGMNFG